MQPPSPGRFSARAPMFPRPFRTGPGHRALALAVAGLLAFSGAAAAGVGSAVAAPAPIVIDDFSGSTAGPRVV
ncbi:MAG: hypothetical protein WBX17_13990, partial [Microbacterium sp.]